MEAIPIIFIVTILVIVIYAHIAEYISMYKIEVQEKEIEVETDIYKWTDVYMIKKRKFLFFWVYEKRKKVCRTNKPLEYLTLKDAEDALKSIASGQRAETYLPNFKIIRRKEMVGLMGYDIGYRFNTYIKKRKWGIFWVYLRNKDGSIEVFDKFKWAEQFILNGKHIPQKGKQTVKKYNLNDLVNGSDRNQ
jgi:hypothetical protein